MKIVFMGSGDLACPALTRLMEHPEYRVLAVVSQPDRPKGRNRKSAPCPVKAMAEGAGLSVWTPEKIGAAKSVDHIREQTPDIIVVAAYGQYITPAILAIPPLGAINIHPSLLPKYRGASPIQWALANGEKETGVSIIRVAKDMDAGDILRQVSEPIRDTDTTETLTERLARIGADLLVETLNDIRQGRVRAVRQNHAQATVVHKLTKEDGRMDWSLPAQVLRNRIRGFSPWPGCFCALPDGSMLKIWQARVEPATSSGQPGTVLSCDAEGPLVGTGSDALRLLEVQPEGKKRMTGNAYLCGHGLKPGDSLR